MLPRLVLVRQKNTRNKGHPLSTLQSVEQVSCCSEGLPPNFVDGTIHTHSAGKRTASWQLSGSERSADIFQVIIVTIISTNRSIRSNELQTLPGNLFMAMAQLRWLWVWSPDYMCKLTTLVMHTCQNRSRPNGFLRPSSHQFCERFSAGSDALHRTMRYVAPPSCRVRTPLVLG